VATPPILKPEPKRELRRHSKDGSPLGGTTFQEDRDRLLYTTALRRLAGVTQVIAPDEGHVVHNRLTHVMEVAHIGRRIAERLLREQPKEARAVGGINPDVVESAALAHDLGHPPFGHIAEEELDKLLLDEGLADGFEGNAQSFRVVTKLCVRRPHVPGLDLTRATLAATLKYPWPRGTSGYRQKKFGHYSSESDDFKFARALEGSDRQTVEASLMDLADDIAYSLSDLEDFIRAGKISIGRLVLDKEEQNTFIEAAHEYLKHRYGVTLASLRRQLNDLIGVLPPLEHNYAGTVKERAMIRLVTNYLMNNYIKGVSVHVNPKQGESYISLAKELRTEIALLKYLTFHYVICDPNLAVAQHAHRKIIRGLFSVFYEAASARNDKDRGFFPKRLHESIAAIHQTDPSEKLNSTMRCIADFIAAMSDREAIDLYQQLHGFSAKSLLRGAV
jgi:dGTPase